MIYLLSLHHKIVNAMINRRLNKLITSILNTRKAIIIIGARQVGKSTLLKEIFGNSSDVIWMNGDEPDIQQLFSQITSTRIKTIIGSKSLIIIDEAQRIADIGLKLKLITDQIPNVQVIATGSSSFELTTLVSR